MSPHDALPACVEALRGADMPVVMGQGTDDWSPDRVLPPSLWELFAGSDDVAAEALALAFAQQRCANSSDATHWLWVQDGGSMRAAGRPYLHGLPVAWRSGLVHVEARNAADALWAMEEGVRCGALSFVLGEIAGDPKALDFTATRRLVLAAERQGVPLYLLRRDGFANLSAARLRWRVEAAPSSAHRWNAIAPGDPRVSAELFRGRGVKPGRFLMGHAIGGAGGFGAAGSHEPRDRLAVVPEFRDRPLEPQRSLAG